MNDEALRLHAASAIQTADTIALFRLIREVEYHVRPLCPSMPDLADEFVRLRQQELERYLEAGESNNPARAAALLAEIERVRPLYPPSAS